MSNFPKVVPAAQPFLRIFRFGFFFVRFSISTRLLNKFDERIPDNIGAQNSPRKGLDVAPDVIGNNLPIVHYSSGLNNEGID
jgi:hypothetical protein